MTRGSLGFAAATLMMVACSTRAPPANSQECEVDEDCALGTICDPFTTRCVTGDELPPRAHLAFDIRERAAGETLFRAELRGCDQEINAGDEEFSQLELSRAQVQQSFLLYAYNTRTPDVPGEASVDELIAATFEVSQPGRLGLPPNPLERDLDQKFREDEVPTRTRIPWPRYHIFDDNRPPPYIVLEAIPEALGPLPAEGEPPEASFAPLVQMLVPPDTYVPVTADGEDAPCQVNTDCCDPPGDCNPGANFCLTATGECTLIGNPEFSGGFSYESRCNREIVGTVALFDAQDGTVGAPINNAAVRFRYADLTGDDAARLGVAPLGLSRAEGCTSDDICGDGRFCDVDSGRCLLALAGRGADSGSSTTDPEGSFSTQVYTYCEGIDDDIPLDRAYGVTVTPAAGLPSVNYAVETQFPPMGGVESIAAAFCVPSWGDPVELQLPLQGAPQVLAQGDGTAAYTCCDVGCLPTAVEDVTAGPPAAPGACRGRTAAGATPSVRFETPLTISAAEHLAWVQAGCVPLALPDEGDGPFVVGALRTDADCPASGEVCQASGLAAGTADDPRRYAVRIQSPTGSVLGSLDVEIEVARDGEPQMSVTLPPRVLVRGVVDVGESVCDSRSDPSDCAARGAVVLAERIAMPGESPESVPGPYLHQVTTFFDPQAGRDGAFVLPLDRGGVYVMTALPAPGEDGGPAAFQIVDLRDASTVPDRRFVLQEGILVTMDLSSFDRRTFVVPLDTGSFIDDALQHPGFERTVDLNAVGECITPAAEGPQGCKIRQLIPPGSNISVSQVGLARFTARAAAGASECATGADRPEQPR